MWEAPDGQQTQDRPRKEVAETALTRRSCRARHAKDLKTRCEGCGRHHKAPPCSNYVSIVPALSLVDFETRRTDLLGTRIDSRNVSRAQLLEDFLTAYYPSLHHGVKPNGWLLKMLDTPASSPLFTAATDALSFAFVGRTKRDPRLVHASRLAYGRVVMFLRESLKQPVERWRFINHRQIVMSIFTLALLDDSMPPTPPIAMSTDTGSKSWVAHWDAAHQFIAVRGPSYFTMTDPLTETLLMVLFHGAVLLGIARRKALASAETAWTDRNTWGRSGGLPDWVLLNLAPVTAAVPGLLERADILCGKTPLSDEGEGEYYDLVDKIVFTRRRLENDMEAVLTKAKPAKINVSNEEEFDLEIEEHCFITSSSTIQCQYAFRQRTNEPFEACDAYIRSTAYALILTCALLRLLYARSALRGCEDELSWESTERYAYFLATELCRTVYQMSQHSSLAIPKWIMLYLELAQNVFAEQAALKEMGWCQSAIIATQVRLRRLLRTHSPTLCRIGDLPPGIAAAGRYKVKGTRGLESLHVECPFRGQS